jgi:lysozyme
MIFGMDVSRWNGGNVDFHRARREGIEFAILRSWDRDANEVDRTFHRNLRVAREAGMIVAAYHFIVPWENGAVNADHVLRHVPAEVPVILDVEQDRNSGRGTPLWLAQDVANRLRAAGRRLPLAYVPRWYWRDHLGNGRTGPDLRGLSDHGLWASRYVNNMGGTPQQIYPHHFRDGWDSYGGLPVRILQFTDESTIAGITPVDANAFLGSREELANLLGEDDMFSDDDREKLNHIQIQFTGNPWNTSLQAGPFHGWQSLWDPSVHATWVDFLIATDFDVYNNLMKAAALKAKLQAINDELLSGEDFDREAFLAKVKEGVKAKTAAEIYELSVRIGPQDEEPTE